MSTKKKISVFIIDDHDSVRQSYIRWIEAEGFTIAGDEKYPDKAVEKIKKTTPDVILMDIDFPNDKFGGIELAKEIINNYKNAKITFITHYTEPEIITWALSTGALGYFAKIDNLSHLKEAIEKTADGYIYISPTAMKKLIEHLSKTTPKEPQITTVKNFNLTETEIKVLKLISQGLTNKEIARELATNEKKVKDIISNICTKLEAKNRAHAVTIAIKYNLI
jgi:DNA-binding NarL/FixJ family response regulator